jgi:hypothetical protein
VLCAPVNPRRPRFSVFPITCSTQIITVTLSVESCSSTVFIIEMYYCIVFRR